MRVERRVVSNAVLNLMKNVMKYIIRSCMFDSHFDYFRYVQLCMWRQYVKCPTINRPPETSIKWIKSGDIRSVCFGVRVFQRKISCAIASQFETMHTWCVNNCEQWVRKVSMLGRHVSQYDFHTVASPTKSHSRPQPDVTHVINHFLLSLTHYISQQSFHAVASPGTRLMSRVPTL